jgi:hypothetical protein
MIFALLRSPRWRSLGSGNGFQMSAKAEAGMRKSQSQLRRLGTYSFAYQPPVEQSPWLELSV